MRVDDEADRRECFLVRQTSGELCDAHERGLVHNQDICSEPRSLQMLSVTFVECESDGG